jgi:hypothetical protein
MPSSKKKANPVNLSDGIVVDKKIEKEYKTYNSNQHVEVKKLRNIQKNHRGRRF